MTIYHVNTCGVYDTVSFYYKTYEYKVRIPITDANNKLMLNAIPTKSARQYTHNDIKVSDTRFFASV